MNCLSDLRVETGQLTARRYGGNVYVESAEVKSRFVHFEMFDPPSILGTLGYDISLTSPFDVCFRIVLSCQYDKI